MWATSCRLRQRLGRVRWSQSRPLLQLSQDEIKTLCESWGFLQLASRLPNPSPLWLQPPVRKCRRASLGPSQSINLTNLMRVHISILLYLPPCCSLPSPSEEPSPLFQRMLPKWRLRERRYSPDCRDEMQGFSLASAAERKGVTQEVVCVAFLSSFIFQAFSDLIWCEITNWPLAAAPCVHNRTH